MPGALAQESMGGRAIADAVGDEHQTDGCGEVEGARDQEGGPQAYTVVQGGTLGWAQLPNASGLRNGTRRSLLPDVWESNRSMRMENVGEREVVNPWLSNGRNNFRTVAEIAHAALAPGMTDAEKAFAIWFQEVQYRHHSSGDNNELGDPVKVFNVYGYNTCGNDSICMGTLLKAVGLKAAPARAPGHCISQAFYDNAWHFFDGDLHCVYLLRQPDRGG